MWFSPKYKSPIILVLSLIVVAKTATIVAAEDASPGQEIPEHGPQVGPKVQDPEPLGREVFDKTARELAKNEKRRRSGRGFGVALAIHGGPALISGGLFGLASNAPSAKPQDDPSDEEIEQQKLESARDWFSAGSLIIGPISLVVSSATMTHIINNGGWHKTRFWAVLVGGSVGLGGTYAMLFTSIRSDSRTGIILSGVLSMSILPAVGELAGALLSRTYSPKTRLETSDHPKEKPVTFNVFPLLIPNEASGTSVPGVAGSMSF